MIEQFFEQLFQDIQPAGISTDGDLLEVALEYIQNHYCEKITLAFPPFDAIDRTKTQAMAAPAKEENPEMVPAPRKTDAVAPRVAPAEMPKIYGSAMEFCTVACMTVPHRASPYPAAKPKITLGTRRSQTTR